MLCWVLILHSHELHRNIFLRKRKKTRNLHQPNLPNSCEHSAVTPAEVYSDITAGNPKNAASSAPLWRWLALADDPVPCAWRGYAFGDTDSRSLPSQTDWCLPARGASGDRGSSVTRLASSSSVLCRVSRARNLAAVAFRDGGISSCYPVVAGWLPLQSSSPRLTMIILQTRLAVGR